MPETQSRFGRGSRQTHNLYIVAPRNFETKKFLDLQLTESIRTGKREKTTKAMLVELRGSGMQTMAPPSIHPDTQEPIKWFSDGEPLLIDYPDLLKCVERLAAACLLARYWPAIGSRNFAALALYGALANAGWTEADAVAFVNPVAEYKGKKKIQEARATFKRAVERQTITGQPTCVQIFGERVWSQVRSLLRLRSTITAATTFRELRPLAEPPSVPPFETVRKVTESNHYGSAGSRKLSAASDRPRSASQRFDSWIYISPLPVQIYLGDGSKQRRGLASALQCASPENRNLDRHAETTADALPV